MAQKSSTTESIAVRGLVKAFGDVVAVDGLDFDAYPGRCLGILGPNGAGKTTTIEMLEGLIEPDRGVIVLFGMSWKHDAKRIRERIGVQLQETVLPDKLRVAEALRVFRSLHPGGRTVEEVLELIGLAEKRGAFVSELSGGQRQRLSLGCALVHRPDVLFLDEPTTGLDPQGRRRIWEVVEEFKRAGGTVILTTHFMEEAERLADELMILDHGRCLKHGTPAEIIDSLGAESILELRLSPVDGDGGDGAGAVLPAEELLGLADVLSVQEASGRLRIGARSFERVIPSALKVLAERGFSPTDLNVHRPTLEDVFVSLTGRELRDS